MQTSPNLEMAKTELKLGNAWQLRGNLEEAIQHYQEALKLNPDYLAAYQQLGNVMLKQRRMDAALEYYEQALHLDFEATNLSFYYQCLGLPQVTPANPTSADRVLFANTPGRQTDCGKINFGQQRIFPFHRSGWHFAIHALSPLHNPTGILFDGCLEDQFLFQHNRPGQRSEQIQAKMRADGVFEYLATSEEKGTVPYQQPWIGFLHNPPAMPIWFNYQRSPQKLFEKQIWQASLPHCLGLFALSESYAEWLRQQTGKPVSALIHPTEIPEKQFDFNQFLANPQKKIVQIGWWLRKLHSIYQLPIPKDNPLGYEKVRLGFLFDSAESAFAQLMKVEARIYKINPEPNYLANTRVVKHIPNDAYDDLLSMNIGFVDLYDSCANNAIIECIARATPLLVNPLPAVKEYLGEAYPMYFNTLEEAATKALDTSLILATHQYLKTCETRQKLSADYFLHSFSQSEVYQSL
jgi:tetratricopeptide (TPR) repeat protein